MSGRSDELARTWPSPLRLGVEYWRGHLKQAPARLLPIIFDHTMSLLDLPLELSELIFTQVSYESRPRPTLKACSLVGWPWKAISQRCLFSTFAHGDDLPSFIAALAINPPLASLVQSLELSRHMVLDPELPSLLASLSNVRTLYLWRLNRWETMTAAALAALQTYTFPNITDLNSRTFSMSNFPILHVPTCSN